MQGAKEVMNRNLLLFKYKHNLDVRFSLLSNS
jgi:hypothetical protein